MTTLLLADIARLDPEASPAALRETLSALYQRARELARSLRGEVLSHDEQRFYALQLVLEHSAELCDRLRSSVALYAMLTDQATPVRWRAGTSRLHLDYGQAWRNGDRAALALGALAASDDIVAGAPFYGVNFGLFDTKTLKKPVQGHFGALDAMEGFSDPATGKRLEKELTNAKVHIYEGVGHAFMNPEPAPFSTFEERQEKMGFPAYDMGQADLAWGRLLDFFLEHLAAPPPGRTDLPIHTPATEL